MTTITLIGPDGDEVDVYFDEQTRHPLRISVPKDSPIPKLYEAWFNRTWSAELSGFGYINWTPDIHTDYLHPDHVGNALKWLRSYGGYHAISEEEDWINGE